MSQQPPPPPPPPGGQQPPPPGPYGQPYPPQQQGLPRPAELLDRFLARLIDGVLLGIVYFILSLIVAAIVVSGFRSTGEAIVFGLVLSILFTATTLGYYGFLETSQGQTVGKMVMKLKVFGPDGTSTPTMEQSLKRNFFYALSLLGIIPFVGSLLGSIAQLAAVIYIAVTINNDTVNRQGFHDGFAGGTRVMKVG